MASSTPNTIPTDIKVRLPSKYNSSKAGTDSAFAPPPLEWLYRTWAVTHSTLSMWRSAQNVRITYKPYVKGGGSGSGSGSGGDSKDVAIDDLVEYEKKDSEPGANVKTVAGIDRPDPTTPLGAAFDWRGKGWLKIASSHWEVLGYGERPLPTTTTTTTTTGEGGQAGDEVREEAERVERWAVTWFAPTLFTKEGLDIYTDRREGLSEETYNAVMTALKALDAPKLVSLVEKEMRPVLINLPSDHAEA